MYKLIILIFILGSTQSLDLCGDWIQFEDIKCLKVLERVGTEEQALGNCTELDQKSSLISIHSNEEQEFLNNILNKFNNISKNSWIGMKFKDNSFKWIDGSPSNYSNWDQDALKDGTEPCAQMSLINPTLGKWDDVSCKKIALIVCQKPQEISLIILKNVIEKQQIELIAQKQEIDTIKANQIPIGFLYIQIMNQNDPQQLWPSFKWHEVTKDYAGLFFRAEGGESLPFGQIQQANQSWISEIKYGDHMTSNEPYEESAIFNFNKNDLTVIDPGYGRAFLNLHFFTTGGEVRPKNTAIKIWKRVQ